jgi:hypothetical protein
MLVPVCGSGRAREEASSEAETNPRARRSPLEGGVSPRARRSPLEGGVDPRARRSLLEGALDWATPAGCGGHHGVGRALGVCLSERCFFWFFAGFKQDSPGCFRGPSGLSPTVAPEHLRACQPGSRRCWNLLIGHSSPLVAKAFCGAASADPRV